MKNVLQVSVCVGDENSIEVLARAWFTDLEDGMDYVSPYLKSCQSDFLIFFRWVELEVLEL